MKYIESQRVMFVISQTTKQNRTEFVGKATKTCFIFIRRCIFLTIDSLLLSNLRNP